MKKRAVVFSGGGAKGGYQIGVWKALNELEFFPQTVTGTSVGALNGALFALGNYEKALEIWENMGMDSVFAEFVKQAEENTLKDRTSFYRFLRGNILGGGADYTPLQEIVRDLMDEERLRNSPIHFGLVTTEFPKIQPVKLFIEDIPEGQAADYVIASAAAFPVMKSYKIGEKTFVDGGFSDNIPIKMAISDGAEEIVVVNIGSSVGSRLSEHNCAIHYISSKKPLIDYFGGIFMFDKKTAKSHMKLGYLDTYKEFGLLDGYYYTFETNEKYKTGVFESRFTEKFEYLFTGLPNVSRFEKSGRERVMEFLVSFESKPFEFNSNILHCIETAADMLEVSPEEVYTLESITEKILELAETTFEKTYLKSIDELEARLQRGLSFELIRSVVSSFDKKIITGLCLKMLKAEKITAAQRRLIWIISALAPNIFCAALFCYAADNRNFSERRGDAE